MAEIDSIIDAKLLATQLGRGDLRVVDCRSDLFDADKGRRDYLAGHIPGAVYADMDEDLASEITPESGRHPLPDPEAFRRWLESCGIGDDTHVVAYDYGNGALAARLWWMLREWFGHSRVSVLDGGIAAWIAAGHEMDSKIPEYPRASFTGIPDETVIATTDEIAANVTAGRNPVLLDAREPGRFNGEHEPVDPVAGHIPGARNVPLGLSLDEDGRWRNTADIGSMWAQITANLDGEQPIVMCGSGVTACHLIISASIAGVGLPRLYVGSWSEWIRDSGRPVAVGQ